MQFIETTGANNSSQIKPLVFISHASKDKEIIKLFVDNILKKGLHLADENIVFTSYEATGVVPGDNIPKYIKRNIANANLVLSMISDNYKKSEVCMNEVGAAWALDKTPVQIMLPKTNFDKLGWLIHLDKAAKIDDKDSLDSLEEVICNSLGIKVPTAKHWNPCTNDFLKEIKKLQECYNDEQPEYLLVDDSGHSEIECHVRYLRNNYHEKPTAVEKPIDARSSNTFNPALFGGIKPDLFASFEQSLSCVRPLGLKLMTKTTNFSFARVQLYLINNSHSPIENGELIITSDNEKVVFAESNVIEKGIDVKFLTPRINQQVCDNSVTETFKKYINPTAKVKLYEFYITAPYGITSFKLLWKLESLKEPKFGEVLVRWNADIEDMNKYVVKGNPKKNTSEVVECLIDEE